MRHLAKASMRSVPVVLMGPGLEMLETLSRLLVAASVGPFPECGLDEAFGFAVGLGTVGASAGVTDIESRQAPPN